MPTAPSVCALGWVKYRENISLLVVLCIIVYVTKKKLFLPISDNGKMLKYRSISSFIEVSTILCLHMYVGYPNLSVYVMF